MRQQTKPKMAKTKEAARIVLLAVAVGITQLGASGALAQSQQDRFREGLQTQGNFESPKTSRDFPSPFTEGLETKLTPEQYHILREKGTEASGSSPLLDNHDKGMFTCAVCGNQLFSSDAKFDSGTGWPSFDQALPGAVEFREDDGEGMNRTEVICAKCGSHLGHLFEDLPRLDSRVKAGGPRQTTGKRFCINGACLIIQKEKNH